MFGNNAAIGGSHHGLKPFSKVSKWLPSSNNLDLSNVLSKFDTCTAASQEEGICVPGVACSFFGGRPSGSCDVKNVCCISKFNTISSGTKQRIKFLFIWCFKMLLQAVEVQSRSTILTGNHRRPYRLPARWLSNWIRPCWNRARKLRKSGTILSFLFRRLELNDVLFFEQFGFHVVQHRTTERWR